MTSTSKIERNRHAWRAQRDAQTDLSNSEKPSYKDKRQLVILGNLSLMLGVVPTLKSELELDVVQEINDAAN